MQLRGALVGSGCFVFDKEKIVVIWPRCREKPFFAWLRNRFIRNHSIISSTTANLLHGMPVLWLLLTTNDMLSAFVVGRRSCCSLRRRFKVLAKPGFSAVAKTASRGRKAFSFN